MFFSSWLFRHSLGVLEVGGTEFSALRSYLIAIENVKPIMCRAIPCNSRVEKRTWFVLSYAQKAAWELSGNTIPPLGTSCRAFWMSPLGSGLPIGFGADRHLRRNY